MKNKTTILSTALCLLPLVLSAVLYGQLPDQVAVHFDSAGNPDGYLPRAAAAFGLPLILAAINLYCHFRVATEPKVENTASFLRTLSRWTAPVLSVIFVPVTLFMAMGQSVPIGLLATSLAGAVLLICGNYLPKCKRNYTIGIKLPWTLNDAENWNHTHRFAGFVWVAGGILVLVNAFVQIPYVNLAVIVCLLVLPFLYSYLLFSRSHKNGNDAQ